MKTVLSPASCITLRCAAECRHQHQVFKRPEAQRADMAHLAACAFLPADGSIVFDSPIVPFGSLILVVLHYAKVRDGLGLPRHAAYLRGFRPWFTRHNARTFWDRQDSPFVMDFSNTMDRRTWNRFPDGGITLVRLALDMDRAIHRQSRNPVDVKGGPALPPTLLAVPKDVPITPEMTPFVTAHAKRQDIPWQEAWHQLREERRVPDTLNPTQGVCDLIDTRLCTHAGTGGRGGLALFHDLRGLLGRGVYNPVRNIRFATGAVNDERIAVMRQYMPADMEAASLDADILAASHDRKIPIMIHGLSKVHVWWPPSPAPQAFAIRDFHVHADLWHTPEDAGTRPAVGGLAAMRRIGRMIVSLGRCA